MMTNDPALLMGLIRTGMILAVSFGVAFTDDQQSAIIAFAGALMAVVSMVLTLVTRKLTTPLSAPSLPEGTEITVVTPEGEPNRTALVV